jgi:hypothetical protein
MAKNPVPSPNNLAVTLDEVVVIGSGKDGLLIIPGNQSPSVAGPAAENAGNGMRRRGAA